MVKHIQKKLLGCAGRNLLMVTGFMGSMAYGTQKYDIAALRRALFQREPQGAGGAMERIPDDPNGDTYFLRAVRKGDVAEVRRLVGDPHLDLNTTDNEGNTDLMLAIKGGGQDIFGENYKEIFNFIVHRGSRNLNLQNSGGQTALLLTVGWGRFTCFKELLKKPVVNPNIPNLDGTTPLIAAIGNTLIPNEVKLEMALRLISDPRVSVNQRGTHNKLPLQIAFEAGLAPQLVNVICRRSLQDHDVAVKKIIRGMLRNVVLRLPTSTGEPLAPDAAEEIADELLALNFSPNLGGAIDGVLNAHTNELNVMQVVGFNTPMALINLVGISIDPRVNVNDYTTCGMNQLVNAIRWKIGFLQNQLGIPLPEPYATQLRTLDYNTQLYNGFLAPQEDWLRKTNLDLLLSAMRPLP